MICIGSIGIGQVARRVIGSTADAVAQKAHCPVAIIRHNRDADESRFRVGLPSSSTIHPVTTPCSSTDSGKRDSARPQFWRWESGVGAWVKFPIASWIIGSAAGYLSIVRCMSVRLPHEAEPLNSSAAQRNPFSSRWSTARTPTKSPAWSVPSIPTSGTRRMLGARRAQMTSRSAVRMLTDRRVAGIAATNGVSTPTGPMSAAPPGEPSGHASAREYVAEKGGVVVQVL